MKMQGGKFCHLKDPEMVHLTIDFREQPISG